MGWFAAGDFFLLGAKPGTKNAAAEAGCRDRGCGRHRRVRGYLREKVHRSYWREELCWCEEEKGPWSARRQAIESELSLLAGSEPVVWIGGRGEGFQTDAGGALW